MRRPIPAHVAARFAADLLKDIVETTAAEQWRHRANVMEWAAPRAGDFAGRAKRQELAEQDRRLAEAAQACRNRASVIELGGEG